LFKDKQFVDMYGNQHNFKIIFMSVLESLLIIKKSLEYVLSEQI